jgi:DNA-binding MarR family transcriptional regulator
MRPDDPQIPARPRAGRGTPPPAYPFGDLLALARLDWVARMASEVAAAGHPGYRPTDAALVRLLRRRGSASIGAIGARLGVTRQAARKLVDGLERRGLAGEARDPADTRTINVSLTPAGEAYAAVVVAVIEQLNLELARRVGAADLAAADRVLRAAIVDPHTAARASALPPPELRDASRADHGSPVEGLD